MDLVAPAFLEEGDIHLLVASALGSGGIGAVLDAANSPTGHGKVRQLGVGWWRGLLPTVSAC